LPDFQRLTGSVPRIGDLFSLRVKQHQTHNTAVAEISNHERIQILAAIRKMDVNTLDGNLPSTAASWYIMYNQKAALNMEVGLRTLE
jgi:hypothetical protein